MNLAYILRSHLNHPKEAARYTLPKEMEADVDVLGSSAQVTGLLVKRIASLLSTLTKDAPISLSCLTKVAPISLSCRKKNIQEHRRKTPA